MLLLVLAALPLWRGSAAELKDDDALEAARSVLSDPHLARISIEREGEGEADPSGWTLRSHAESPDHPAGVFFVRAALVDVYRDPPLRLSWYGSTRWRVLSVESEPTRDVCYARALGFLRKYFGWFFAERTPLRTVAIPPDYRGYWWFDWIRESENSLPVAHATVHVRAVDGKIVGFGVGAAPAASLQQERDNFRVPPDQLREQIRRVASSEDGALETQVFAVLPGWREGRDVYEVHLRRELAHSGDPLQTTVRLDGQTGQPVGSGRLHWHYVTPTELRLSKAPQDGMPTWTKYGLVFVSNRRLGRVPAWARYPRQVFIYTNDGDLRYLTADSEPAIEGVSGRRSTSRILIRRSGHAHILDLETGRASWHHQSAYRERATDISPSGEHVCVPLLWGRETPVARLSILSADGENSQQGDTRPPVWLPRRCANVVFGQKMEVLYLALPAAVETGAPVFEQRLCSLTWAPGSDVLREQDAEEVARVSSPVQRITAFPDGRRLLIWHRTGLMVFNTDSNEQQTLTLPPLIDSHLPGGPPLETKDFVAGPGHDQLTFSGLRRSGNDEESNGWFIYTCSLDGSNVKRVTPLTMGPVEPYVFPESGVSALKVAKSMALVELRSEEAEN